MTARTKVGILLINLFELLKGGYFMAEGKRTLR